MTSTAARPTVNGWSVNELPFYPYTAFLLKYYYYVFSITSLSLSCILHSLTLHPECKDSVTKSLAVFDCLNRVRHCQTDGDCFYLLVDFPILPFLYVCFLRPVRGRPGFRGGGM
jgi:hypothetical protein